MEFFVVFILSVVSFGFAMTVVKTIETERRGFYGW